MRERKAEPRVDAAAFQDRGSVRSGSMILGDMSRLSDADLMSRIADGDRQAFTQLVDRHGPTAIALAHRVLRRSSLAEEAVQEAFLAVWREPARYRLARGSVRTWLLSIVHHRAVDVVRREGSQFMRANLLASEQQVAGSGPDLFEDTVVRELGMAEQGRAVRDALNGLPPAQQQIITLMYFDGLSQTQISERLSLPLGTVKSRSLLGMRRLRSTFSEMER